MYYKFINEAGELCGLACGGDPQTEGTERIEITEEEYVQLLNDLIARAISGDALNNDNSNE